MTIVCSKYVLCLLHKEQDQEWASQLVVHLEELQQMRAQRLTVNAILGHIWEANFEEVGETPACVIIKNLYYASLKLNLSLRLKSKTNCSLEALS
uniref:Uncharacterized protein n=1 Tax=Anguilla anguilla TaxID=7936 RepID=A0A0E9XI98_ANGAN